MHCSNFSPEIPIDGRWRCECDTCNSIRFAWNQRTESIKQKDAKQWNKGKTDVAEFNRLTAQYVAGYVTKKINSQQIGDREKEFSFMSKNPGIGALAVEDIGNHLNHRVNKLKEWDGDVPSYLKHGGKIMPLGKYMKNKLRAYLKVGERTVLEKKGVYSDGKFCKVQFTQYTDIKTKEIKNVLCRRDPTEYNAHRLTATKITRQKRYSAPSGTVDQRNERARKKEEEALAKAHHRGVPLKDWWKEKKRIKDKKMKTIEMRNYKPSEEIK